MDESTFIPKAKTPSRTEPLYLCTGLQGSGSSLVSWCFLQRRDMNGILDAACDLVPVFPEKFDSSNLWCKMTISSFNSCELIDYFQSLGWSVRPLLVVRDVRETWAGLTDKDYGRNGTTAEDPPWRMRMIRFLSDWKTFIDRGWPIIQYEALVKDPVVTLQSACEDLDLPWDQAMIDWPKRAEQIAESEYCNATFANSRSDGLLKTIRPNLAGLIKYPIAQQDLEWLESTFAKFNQTCGYPEHRDSPSGSVETATPSFSVSRRYEWKLRAKPIRWLKYRWGRNRNRSR